MAGSGEKKTDGQLLGEFVRERSQGCFAQLMERHGPMVYSVCMRMLGQRQDAEDAVQAVFLMLAQKAWGLQKRASVAGWLHQAACNVALHARRAQAIRQKHQTEALFMQQADKSIEQGWEELRESLDTEINALPEKYRLPVILHHFEGCSHEEGAAVLGCSVGTFSGRVSRARDLLRERLGQLSAQKKGKNSGPASVLSAGALAGLLSHSPAPTLPAALIASTAKAAALTAAGNAAMTGLISAKAAALTQGTLKVIYMANIKFAAIIAAAFFAVGIASFTTYRAMGQGPTVAVKAPVVAPAPPAAPGPRPAIAATQHVEPIDFVKVQTEALAKKLDVNYRKAFLSEVLRDLKSRSGVTIAWPGSIDGTFTLSLEAKSATVREILEKVTINAGLKLEFLPEVAAIDQPADPAVLATLAERLKDPDRWVRCVAAWDTADLGDRKVVSMLVPLLNDPDDGVVEWTVRGLLKHVSMIRLAGDEQKKIINDVMVERLGNEAIDRQPRAMWGGFHNTAAQEAALLGATRTSGAQLALIGWAQDVDVTPRVRSACISNLIPSGATDAVGLLIAIYNQAKEVTNAAQARRQNAGNKNFAIDTEEMAAMQVEQAVLTALRLSRAPQASEFVAGQGSLGGMVVLMGSNQMAIAGNYDSSDSFAIPAVFPASAIETLNKALNPPDPNAPNVALRPVGPSSIIGGQAVNSGAANGFSVGGALNTLGQMGNPGAAELIVKVINNAPIMKMVGQASQYQLWWIEPTDASIVDALLAQLANAGDDQNLKIYIVRSLGHSFDPRAADALIKLLNDPDSVLRAEAAKALANTRDPRAADAIAQLLRTPSTKLSWPDLEKEAADKMAKGEPTRTVLDPRKSVAIALAGTRDPKALELLLAISVDAQLEPEARQAAQLQLAGAATNDSQIDALASGLAKMPPADQRTALMLPANLWMWGMPTPDLTGRSWNDERIVDLIVTRAHDEQATMIVNNVKRHNDGINRLAHTANPRAELALYKLCKDEDEHIAYFAGRGLQQAGDPQIDVQFEK